MKTQLELEFAARDNRKKLTEIEANATAFGRSALSRLDRLVGKEYVLFPFAQLPEPAKLAIVYYKAVDGEAWEALYDYDDELDADSLRRLLPAYEKRYAEVLIGLLEVPSEQLITAIMQDEEISARFDSWQEYQAFYLAGGDITYHSAKDRWPAILSNSDEETLQDGWHRTHAYILQGHTTIPLLFFPEEHHIEQYTPIPEHTRKRRERPC